MVGTKLLSWALPLIEQPQPGKPPGAAKITTLLSWGMWIVVAVAVEAAFITAAMMVVSYNQGRGSDHLGRLGAVLGGMILAGAAAGLANQLIT